MPRLAAPDPALPSIVTMTQALAAGLSPDQVRQRVRAGRWERLSRGVYRTVPPPSDLSEWDAARRAHADRAVAEVLAHPGSFIGLHSAAVVHELPTWRAPAADVSLVAGPGGHNGRRPGVVVHRLELRQKDVSWRPVPITSVARTWFDVTRSHRLADGLVLGDAAIRGGRMSVADASDIVAASLARRGVRVAEQALRHLDGQRETPLESASWAYFVENSLPLPRMQVEIHTRGGVLIGRVDFLWEEARLVGEADGRWKYTSGDALYAEKRREDGLRDEGFRVVRWGAVDLRSPDLATHLRRILSQPSHRSS